MHGSQWRQAQSRLVVVSKSDGEVLAPRANNIRKAPIQFGLANKISVSVSWPHQNLNEWLVSRFLFAVFFRNSRSRQRPAIKWLQTSRRMQIQRAGRQYIKRRRFWAKSGATHTHTFGTNFVNYSKSSSRKNCTGQFDLRLARPAHSLASVGKLSWSGGGGGSASKPVERWNGTRTHTSAR